MSVTLSNEVRRSVPALRRLAIVVDLEEARQDAIESAMALPIAPGAHVALVHVLPAGSSKAARQAATTQLRACAALLLARRADLGVDIIVRTGDTSSEIAEHASGSNAELVVLSRQVSSRGRSMTIAERLASRRDVPTLVTTGRQLPYRRALVAVGSPGAAVVAPVELAHRLFAEAGDVHVAYVADPAVERRMSSRGAPRWAVLMTRRWMRQTMLGQLRASLGHDMTRGRIPPMWAGLGEPTGAILRLADRTSTDLLIVAVDRRWLRRPFFRSSVVARLLDRARCDVLLTRDDVRVPRAGATDQAVA